MFGMDRSSSEQQTQPPAQQKQQQQQRKKVPLKTGHGLNDWIKLSQQNHRLGGQTRSRGVTADELRQHKTVETGVWTVLKGNVYNITPYLEYHPGGVAELMKGAGKDCTLLFEKRHPWVNYNYFLASCYIGPYLGGSTSEDKQDELFEFKRPEPIEKQPKDDDGDDDGDDNTNDKKASNNNNNNNNK